MICQRSQYIFVVVSQRHRLVERVHVIATRSQTVNRHPPTSRSTQRLRDHIGSRVKIRNDIHREKWFLTGGLRCEQRRQTESQVRTVVTQTHVYCSRRTT